MTLVILSTFDIYKWTLFKLPGFVSERVATRLVIVGVLGLALVGSTQLDRWVRREPNRSWRIAAVGLATALLLLQPSFAPIPSAGAGSGRGAGRRECSQHPAGRNGIRG